MRCSKVRKYLSAFVSDQTDPHLAAAMQAHIEHCKSCRSEEEALRKLDRLLEDEINFTDDPFLAVRVKAIARERALLSRYKNIGAVVQKALPPTIVAAGLIVGIFIGAALNNALQNKSTPIVAQQAGPTVIDSHMFTPTPSGSITASYINMTGGE